MIFPFMELITWIAGEKANFQIREQEEVAITTNLKEYELRFEEKRDSNKIKKGNNSSIFEYVYTDKVQIKHLNHDKIN